MNACIIMPMCATTDQSKCQYYERRVFCIDGFCKHQNSVNGECINAEAITDARSRAKDDGRVSISAEMFSLIKELADNRRQLDHLLVTGADERILQLCIREERFARDIAALAAAEGVDHG